MKTICIKTNNLKATNYLLENIEKLHLDNVYCSFHKFKIYNNIFIHYKGKNKELFLSTISHILVFLVFKIYENTLIKRILKNEYFYFDSIEKKEIIDIIQKDLKNNTYAFTNKESILFNDFYDFLNNEDILYLQGFINFRIKKYIQELENIVEEAINQYLIQKEYNEFVSLLKLYISQECSKIDIIHLVYCNNNPILLDKNKNIIKTDINTNSAKYLSDITFSSSDIILNTLLNLLPKKIYIHLIDKDTGDFINTLKLIFENRVNICTDCNICRIYKKI